MAQKSKRPAAVATAGGAKGIAVLNESAPSLAETATTGNRPEITSLRRGPGGTADWLVSIKGVCTDTHFRHRKLRNYRKFCNAIKHRFGITFDPMPQSDWLSIVEAAITEGVAA